MSSSKKGSKSRKPLSFKDCSSPQHDNEDEDQHLQSTPPRENIQSTSSNQDVSGSSGTPSKKKRYFNTPTKSPGTPSSSWQIKDFTGYVVKVSNKVSQNGKEYMDVQLKHSMEDYVVIRIMKEGNSAVNEHDIKQCKVTGTPVNFVKLSKSNTSETYFFNFYRGSRYAPAEHINFKLQDGCELKKIKEVKEMKDGSMVCVMGYLAWIEEKKVAGNGKDIREAVVLDDTGDIALAFWEDLDETFPEKQVFRIDNVVVRNYHGLKLGQQKETTVTKIESSALKASWDSVNFKEYIEHDKVVFNKTNPLLCCPEISNVTLDIYPACTNEKCNTKLILIPGAKIVTCSQESCKKSMKISKCKVGFICQIEFENSTSLHLPADVLEKYIGEDISSYQNNTNSLVEKILFLENVDYRHNTRNHIIEMTDHENVSMDKL